jgi:4-hydroxy-tetrahydrodipicolinate synthase
MELLESLHGIIPPLVTPLLDQNTLDVDGLERLVEHVLDGGVSGVFVLGTTGEFASLTYELRRECITQTCRIVNERVPVFVGVADTSPDLTVEMTTYARNAGVSCVVLAPPYYYLISQPELLAYMQHLIQQLPLPVLLYNMPGTTKLTYEPATVRALADLPNVVGLKDSSNSMIYFNELLLALKDIPDFALFVGPDALLAEAILLGARGGICASANVYPNLLVQVYNAARDKDVDRVRELQEILMRLRTTVFSVGTGGSRYIKCIKYALAAKGICSAVLAEPMQPFSEEEKAEVERLVAHT